MNGEGVVKPNEVTASCSLVPKAQDAGDPLVGGGSGSSSSEDEAGGDADDDGRQQRRG